MKKIDQVLRLGEQILNENPDPVVKYRIWRDLLEADNSCDEFFQAGQDLERCPSVRELELEQHPDGSWGRFHTRDRKVKQKFATTEQGVERGLALGIGPASSVMSKAARYISTIISDKVRFPDPPEKNQRWKIATKLFTASTLCRIRNDFVLTEPVWQTWNEIAQRTFEDGKYSKTAEKHAHEELTGITEDLRYLTFNNRYTITLLASRADDLDEKLTNAIQKWLWHKSDGLGFLDCPLYRMPGKKDVAKLDRWFTSLEIMSNFKNWRKYSREMVSKLWDARTKGDLWDFGPKAKGSIYWPLSADWKNDERARVHDYSVRILTYLKRYYTEETANTEPAKSMTETLAEVIATV